MRGKEWEREEERVGRERTLASASVVVGLGECCLDGVLSTTNAGVDSLSADPLWGEVGAWKVSKDTNSASRSLE